MKPKRLVILGAAVAIISICAVVAISDRSGLFAIAAFAGGALFGKGYGIMEARGQV